MPRRAVKVGARSATDFHTVLGQKMRLARLTAELSQAELGKKIGVTFQQVQKYERGSNRVDFARMIEIAKVLGVGVEYFSGALDGKRAPKAIEFDAVLASREGHQIIDAMKEMTQSQRQFLIDIARKLPHLAA